MNSLIEGNDSNANQGNIAQVFQSGAAQDNADPDPFALTFLSFSFSGFYHEYGVYFHENDILEETQR